MHASYAQWYSVCITILASIGDGLMQGLALLLGTFGTLEPSDFFLSLCCTEQCRRARIADPKSARVSKGQRVPHVPMLLSFRSSFLCFLMSSFDCQVEDASEELCLCRMEAAPPSTHLGRSRTKLFGSYYQADMSSLQ